MVVGVFMMLNIEIPKAGKRGDVDIYQYTKFSASLELCKCQWMNLKTSGPQVLSVHADRSCLQQKSQSQCWDLVQLFPSAHEPTTDKCLLTGPHQQIMFMVATDDCLQKNNPMAMRLTKWSWKCKSHHWVLFSPHEFQSYLNRIRHPPSTSAQRIWSQPFTRYIRKWGKSLHKVDLREVDDLRRERERENETIVSLQTPTVSLLQIPYLCRNQCLIVASSAAPVAYHQEVQWEKRGWRIKGSCCNHILICGIPWSHHTS